MRTIKYVVLFFLLFGFSGHEFFLKGEPPEKTRKYLTTGSWYPHAAGQLNAVIDECFRQTETAGDPGKIVGIVAPHAGYAYSGLCAAGAYKRLSEHTAPIERVFLLGVSHGSRFTGAAVSTFHYNATPLGNIPVDTAVTSALAKEKNFRADNGVMQREHSIENHLPFLQKALKGKTYKIVPILFGHLEKKDFKTMAAVIKKHLTPKSLVIASTDLTHYGGSFGYTPFKDNLEENLTQLDKGIIQPIVGLDFETYFAYMKKTRITMCGFVPVGVLIELFAGSPYTGTLVDYYKSGDRNNRYEHCVSYASVIFGKNNPGPTGNKKKSPKQKINKNNPVTAAGDSRGHRMSLNKKEQDVLLNIARHTLEAYLGKNKEFSDQDLQKKYAITETLKAQAGVFVTLKRRKQLRGCIGTIVGVDPLFCGVRDNAVKAAVKDYRFPNVTHKELKNLHIEVSVMTPLQPIMDYKRIRLGTDGVIIRLGNRRAVFLPQVATETGWNLDQFLGNLCRKAGLPSNAYLPAAGGGNGENMEFYIFQAQVFGEK